jgi:hypothetical protein
MADKLFDIAFSGQIVDGADLQSVKQKIGKIFKADETRLAQMFSGRRVLIKRQTDEITMIKYRGAFQKAGAVCEIVDLSVETTSTQSATPQPVSKSTESPQNNDAEYISKYPESDEVPQALLSTPLDVSAENIKDLVTDIAPVGSSMQYQIENIDEPVIDISGIGIEPVGSDISLNKGDEPPPPPDTAGLTMAD